MGLVDYNSILRALGGLAGKECLDISYLLNANRGLGLNMEGVGTLRKFRWDEGVKKGVHKCLSALFLGQLYSVL